LLNATIGTIQEWRAEQSAHSLQSMLKTRAHVRRAGRRREIATEEVVPGDVVLLESGDRVPADIRLFQVRSLALDESLLTGESMATVKSISALDEEIPVSERKNMAYAGSTVASGRGAGIAVATATGTEVGKIAKFIAEEAGGKPPLLIRTERFARQIAVIVLVFSVVIGVVLFSQGTQLEEVFFIVIAMAVSAIPEGLPVALTVVLSIASARMAKRNVIVRKLTAVESLGSCTCIASDKTGTLTVNQQTVKVIELPGGRRVEVSGQGYNTDGEAVIPDETEDIEVFRKNLEMIARPSVLSNEASFTQEEDGWEHQGDAMDVALLVLSHKLGLDPETLRNDHELVAQIPFESDRRYNAAAYRNVNGLEVAAKGAMESVLPFCRRMRRDGEVVGLDEDAIRAQVEAMAEDGYRVLVVAVGPFEGELDPESFDDKQIPELTVVGLVGFIDPLRKETKAAVREAMNAGVRVVMITGDHPATALTIARELDIASAQDQAITGQELARLREEEADRFREVIKQTAVFARVSPQQKLEIVDALIEAGEYVAVTGDGVNYAPALRKANIGVAMGSGTDVAKDTALMIAVDDNFASIVSGIEEGRFAYANVRKVTLLLISTGAAELLLLALAIFFQFPVPLLAVQILWLNLVTNGIQDVALAFEAGERKVMDLPPRRPTEGLFNRLMIEQVIVAGLTMGLVCFAFWIYLMANGWEVTAARNLLLTLLVTMQFYHVLNCRSEYQSAFRIPIRNNPVLAFGMLAALIVHILGLHLPWLQGLLRTEPLNLETWLMLLLLASPVMIVMELYKWILDRDPVRNGMRQRQA
jgi:magnesium-transporting ATPase (P-type)